MLKITTKEVSGEKETFDIIFLDYMNPVEFVLSFL